MLILPSSPADVGTNFETAFVTRLNADGAAMDDGSDASALNIIGYGTEQGPLPPSFLST